MPVAALACAYFSAYALAQTSVSTPPTTPVSPSPSPSAQAEHNTGTARSATGPETAMPWMHDDWSGAAKKAAARGQHVIVDVWATWCHTCLSMKAFTLEASPIRALKDEFVWVFLEYEKPENTEFFERFPITGFPTMLVIDPKRDAVVGRWVGSGSPEEIATFLRGTLRQETLSQDALPQATSLQGASSEETSKSAHATTVQGTIAQGTIAQRAIAQRAINQALSSSERALGSGDTDTAKRALAPFLSGPQTEALKAASPELRTQLLGRYLEALWKSDEKACAVFGRSRLLEVELSSPGLDFIDITAMCGTALPLTQQILLLKQIQSRLETWLNEGDVARHLSTDDTSAMLALLAGIQARLGEKDEAHSTTMDRLALLESEAKRAPTPKARAVFDAHRFEIYAELGRFDDAERMIEASQEAEPDNFNHPWRLALLYLQSGAYDRGLAAIDRALQLGYGGRKLRLYATKLDLLLKKGDRKGAQATALEAKAALSARERPVGRREKLRS
ncbi:MAG: thioredoxin family protein [Deltaproteobacteria bacterium]|nr:thioredoxin family protein [Deltaproteobacteria bacterium]